MNPRTARAFCQIALIVITTMAMILMSAHFASAQTFSMDLGPGGGTATGRIVQLLVLLTVLSLAPSLLVMITSFTRIVVVLSFLRTAMGTQQTPPNQVLISLALFLTLFVMMPVMQESYDEGIAPLMAEQIDEFEAFERAIKPIKGFMMSHVREQDLILFSDLSGETDEVLRTDMPLRILIPAFIISELKRAFEIGFLVFVPFLVIDMVVASVLMSMGMMMLPPIIIALPFKIIFFVLVDGWYLIVGSLVKSFGG
ncbi:MAG: flagellar type III secretion system pore protein FliP [Rhodospirillales bacterium]|nr:flagellar type III secretion system pore protein FliP [Rhodospirillales bacterium]